MPLIYAGRSNGVLKNCGAHRHRNYFEITLNCEGSGVEYVDGKEYPFFPGSIHVIPPDAVHYKISDGGFADVYFTFSDAPGFFSGTMISQDDEEKNVEKIMSLLASRYLSSKPGDPMPEELFRLAIRLISERFGPEAADPLAEKVACRLRASFADPETDITEILSGFGYSADHVRRRFAAAYKTSPQQYLISLRVECAKHLLSLRPKTFMSVSQIGETCGFLDPVYFSRAFKKLVGVPPSEYPL
ncbi:MAG: helix-turn-helix domain-containing protein [Clostridia bacterium]|nr:helix-turn-helix domain-containing protein [Clostridia bacterium]